MSQSSQETHKVCPECGEEKWAFLVVERPDGQVRCDNCQTNLDRVLHALKVPKPDPGQRVFEAKQALRETDHWDYPSYRKGKHKKTLDAKDNYRILLRKVVNNPELDMPEKP